MKKEIRDIPDIFTGELPVCEDIESPEKLRKLMEDTPARIGIGHAGARCRTIPTLRFWADQAIAADAVFTEVDPEVIRKIGVFEVKTKCKDKYEMLTRPDKGREFDEDQKQLIRSRCTPGPQVQIYFGDGLCSPSVEANIPDLLPAITKGLEYEGITVGTPFFVRYCRVNTARTIAPLLGAEVTCTLIGERPGLLTAQSMSAYIAYRARPDMLESEYTVVSNISRHGIPPVEAAAYIVDLIVEILRQKKSGVNLSVGR